MFIGIKDIFMCNRKGKGCFSVKQKIRHNIVWIGMSAMLMTACGVRAGDGAGSAPTEQYVYEYADSQGKKRQLSIDYHEEFLYEHSEYYDSTSEHEASPDWGINIYFSGEKDRDYLYFYACFGKGYRPVEEYPEEEKEVFTAGDYSLVLISLEEEVIGYSSMGTEQGQGILIRMSKERWAELSDVVLDIAGSAKII